MNVSSDFAHLDLCFGHILDMPQLNYENICFGMCICFLVFFACFDKDLLEITQCNLYMTSRHTTH